MAILVTLKKYMLSAHVEALLSFFCNCQISICLLVCIQVYVYLSFTILASIQLSTFTDAYIST